MIKTENEIRKLIKSDKWMMDILKAVRSMNLPDCWVCAGFVRSKIWDVLHERNERSSIPDVDVIYFDPTNLDELNEKKHEEKLRMILPDVPWSVKNEARMHIRNNMLPYSSSVDAIAKFPETATALGVKLDINDKLILTAPHGIMDLINLEVKPTPFFTENIDQAAIYENRIKKKNWKSIWNRIKIHHIQP
ncbi:hypothetical protein BACCIP111895_00198 [Neobacillus rhizosphaerae]|uniref:Nucleotidyltransferase family protein n=1 Tax=Neobacillus rhizosphaerae TaxID=2880965 RepID=A0ABM9EKG6_9BACI|nr:hypothetical protein BACCIP111895_00198 [Neobacillus rhizosphaerae]